MELSKFPIWSALIYALLSSHCLAQITNYEAEGNLESSSTLGCAPADQVSNTHTPVDIFRGLAECLELKDYDRAAFLYSIGMAYGLFDTERVKDKSAHQAISVLRINVLGGSDDSALTKLQNSIDTIMSADSGSSQICGRLEEIGPPKYHPAYMIQHGMGAFGVGETGLVDGFQDGAAWSEILETSFSCSSGVNDILKAIRGGDTKKVELIVQQSSIDLNFENKRNITPLIQALLAEDIDLFQYLLSAGADPNYLTERGTSVLSLAAQKPTLTVFLEACLAHGADPNLVHPGPPPMAPLSFAVDTNNVEGLTALAESGADINAQDWLGSTPMISAATTNQYRVVYQLLQLGADPLAQSARGDTLATRMGETTIGRNTPEYAWHKKVVKWLKRNDIAVKPRVGD